MNHHEAREALTEIRSKLAPKAITSLTVSDGKTGATLNLTIWPEGIGVGHNLSISARAEEFDELFKIAETGMQKYKDERAADIIRKMAMKIIDLSDPGPCTDRDLRLRDFTEAEIAEYGEAACSKAAEMGGNSPFVIERTQAANAA